MNDIDRDHLDLFLIVDNILMSRAIKKKKPPVTSVNSLTKFSSLQPQATQPPSSILQDTHTHTHTQWNITQPETGVKC